MRGIYFILLFFIALHSRTIEAQESGPFILENTLRSYEWILPAWMHAKLFLLDSWQWIALLIGLVAGIVLRWCVSFFFAFLLRFLRLSKSEQKEKIFQSLRKPVSYLILFLFWSLFVQGLRLESGVESVLVIALKFFAGCTAAWVLYNLTDFFDLYFRRLAARTQSTLDDHLVPLANRTLKIGVVIIGFLFVLQNLGINVMSLLAGLGIGGLAFALAAKDTIANFFGSLMILFDGPFQVGDWVIIGDAEGTVEEIGFRSTRIRTFYDSVISIPNAEIMNSMIDNMGRREYRRTHTTIGITYDTPPQKIETFIEGIKQIIMENPVTRKDYFHVVFKNFGADSLEIMLYFFLKVSNWSEELVQRQSIYLAIVRLAEELQVEFAFPTRTIHIDDKSKMKPLRNEPPDAREQQQALQ